MSMHPDFPDELLSGLLDDELSPSERLRVEEHLAHHPADRQLLQELKALQEDVRRLAPVTVPPDFAQRVVQAALSAQQEASVAPPAVTCPSRRVPWGMVAVGIASVAAALVLGLWLGSRFPFAPEARGLTGPSRNNPSTNNITSRGRQEAEKDADVSAAPTDIAAALRQALAATGSGQALVVRLRVKGDFPSGAQLDAALSQAGLALRPPSDLSTGASALAPAWRQAVQERLAGAGTSPASLAGVLATPSDALWIEGSPEALQRLLDQLGRQAVVAIVPEARLAASARPADAAEGEGEPGQRPGKKDATEMPTSGSLAQHVPPTLFPLPQEPISPSIPSFAPPGASATGRQRVLLLIERVE